MDAGVALPCGRLRVCEVIQAADKERLTQRLSLCPVARPLHVARGLRRLERRCKDTTFSLNDKIFFSGQVSVTCDGEGNSS